MHFTYCLRRAAGIVVLTIIASTVFCSRQKDSDKSATRDVLSSARLQAPLMQGGVGGGKGGEAPGESDQDVVRRAKQDAAGTVSYLNGPGILPMEKGAGRLLEYHIELTYNALDFAHARKTVLAVAARYGFIRSSAADAHRRLTLNTEMAVRVENMYDALKDLDAAGVLVSENITVTDHTERMAQERMKVDRETLRSNRRVNAVGGDPSAKNWKDREDLLEKSEDARDAAEMEKWKIKDRVAWTVITVSIQGPQVADGVEIPPYKRAFLGIVSMFLWIGYALIWISPLLLIAGLVVWKRRQIGRLFRKKSA